LQAQEKVSGTKYGYWFLTPFPAFYSLWTAKIEVPKDGCPSPAVRDSRLKENVDDKNPRKKKTAAEAAK